MTIHEGLRVRDKSGNLLEIVSIDYSDKVPMYDLKYVHEDNTLSTGTVVVFGSQLEQYTWEV